ncbi:MAG: hypothetical protein A4E53_00022 [Pelotomaculum sp. PtaB.Bin104]|nr:MAG: hypothetical protein A4E53_00022 [Pelotomaculum sp. PtaB.Bin104]
MDIHVSKHAIKRYRERLFDFRSSDEIIEKLLRDIAFRGRRIESRPAASGKCYEVIRRGISIVLVIDDESNATILTCLGNEYYRKWLKHQDMLRIPGRILFSQADQQHADLKPLRIFRRKADYCQVARPSISMR